MEAYKKYYIKAMINNFLKKLKKEKPRKQNTFCYCPQCHNELVSSNSLVSDEEFATYKCSNCECLSRWDFDIAPVPVLIDYDVKLHFDKPEDIF